MDRSYFQKPFVRSGLAIVLIAVLVFAATELSGRLSELRTRLTNNVSTAEKLEQELGYGGLIHNFKNAILRPDEPRYKESARRNMVDGRQRIVDLENAAARGGVSIDLSSVRDMINAYDSRLDTIEQMAAKGVSAREIDAAVRFNDEYALRSIYEAVGSMSKAIYEEVNALYQLVLTLLFSVFAAIGLVVYGYTRISSSRRELALVNDANLKLDKGNKKLAQSNLRLKQFAGIASHDLKTPIRHIQFFADELQDNAQDEEQVNELSGKLSDTAHRMGRLVSSLMEFTKVQFTVPNRAQVPLREIVDNALTELEPELRASEPEICVALDDDLKVFADGQLLLRVCVNLISNAIKYVAPDVRPRITIDAQSQSDGTTVRVSDNGIGIESQFRDRVFDPMERLHTQDAYSGVGIGLSLVKSIVEAHGGTIKIDDSPAGGTQFLLFFPVK